MARPPKPRMQLRISGKRALLILAILALIFAGALYWALYPLYARGKEGLQSKPAPTDAAPNRSTE